MGTPLYHSGHSDVWQGKHQERKVAVKVLTVCVTSNLDKITRVGSLIALHCFDELTVAHTEVLQGGGDVEGSLPSERAAPVRGDNDPQPICDGIGMDGQWEYQ